MADLREVALFVSPDVEEVLADNGVDIVVFLQEKGLDVKRSSAVSKFSTRSGSKEPVTIILASAAVIIALTPIIIKLISTLSRKQVLVVTTVLVPVENSNGEPVLDTDGNPMLQWVDKVEMLDSGAKSSDATSGEIETPVGFKFRFKVESHG